MRDRAWLRRARDAITLCYFAGEFEPCTIGWAPWKQGRQSYGYAFVEYRQIWINRALSYPAIPDFVVVHTLYHEMLHIKLGHEHDDRFALAERRFAHFTESMLWHERNCEELVLAAKRPDWRLLR